MARETRWSQNKDRQFALLTSGEIPPNLTVVGIIRQRVISDTKPLGPEFHGCKANRPNPRWGDYKLFRIKARFLDRSLEVDGHSAFTPLDA
jgi:hypothetical protein